MGDILDDVEAEFAPAGADQMRMPSQTGQSFRTFEDGGVRIMLIGHHLYINPTGAIGWQSHVDMDHFMFTKPSAAGDAFVPRPVDA
ncbi:hypothetical protein [Luteibacter aegosomatissinici]|uniref:hypothetical protein n=1 Tax=Luteibacter aegosomatissinici TaxID=2911539 RepID=UPI001FF7074C|nr:hypothetical protein [Luteibacter aegosomatissinici]UPG92852.1 hypothetical protein L2Y97_13355 [Luteibacter aegosomatissinici]